MSAIIKQSELVPVTASRTERPFAAATDSPFAAIFDEMAFLSTDDCHFLSDIFQRFPQVRNGFSHFLGFEPEDRLAEAIEVLKMEPRAAWPRIGVPHGMIQSVAGHHADTMKLAFMIAADNMDPEHIARMMAVHDLAESITGDFISAGRYKDPIVKPEKQRLERIALRLLLQDFPDESVASDIQTLWEEYEEGQTRNAVMAHDIDKLELVMQAQYYESLYPDLKPAFKEMWDAADKGVKTPEGRSWLSNLLRQPQPHDLKTHNRAVFTFPWDI